MTPCPRDDVLDLCASLPGTVEDYLFGESAAAFKVLGRMFALVTLEGSPAA
jgi:predicted DNA-binding protein (MmcQ/YjbR family)